MRRWLAVTVVVLVAEGPAIGYAQTPGGKMKDEKMKMDDKMNGDKAKDDKAMKDKGMEEK